LEFKDLDVLKILYRVSSRSSEKSLQLFLKLFFFLTFSIDLLLPLRRLLLVILKHALELGLFLINELLDFDLFGLLWLVDCGVASWNDYVSDAVKVDSLLEWSESSLGLMGVELIGDRTKLLANPVTALCSALLQGLESPISTNLIVFAQFEML
jgi:hypothetical protein